MNKSPSRQLTSAMFDYSRLEPQLAKQVSDRAQRIRQRVKKTVEGIIEVGKELLTVKALLPHGRFGAWLKTEFGWGERTAENFMNVAERFGAKYEIIADLMLQPTAAYLLAAPTVPDQAREKAISRAEAGEQITAALAKEIVSEARKGRDPPDMQADILAVRLTKVLERYRDRWDRERFADLARQLRQFAAALERQKGGKRSKKSAGHSARHKRTG